jgi:CRP-like cAMP-binding protein
MASPQKKTSRSRKIAPEQLMAFVPINSLDSERLQELVRHAVVVTIPKGAKLFAAGDEDNRILYLLSGELELRRPGETSVLSSTSDDAQLPIDAHQPRKFYSPGTLIRAIMSMKSMTPPSIRTGW